MAMKITFRPAIAGDASQDVVLADGADRAADNVRGPASGTVAVSIGSQRVSPIGAAAAKFYGRGNRAGAATFEASRRFASIPAASRFMFMHGMTVPAEGTLILDFSDGGDVVAYFGCVITQVGVPSRSGVHVATSYSLNFGAAAEVSPANLQDQINAYYGYVPSRRINAGGVVEGDWGADDEALVDGVTTSESWSGPVAGAAPLPNNVYVFFRSSPESWAYAIPLPAQSYDLKLYWAEPSEDAIGARLFSVAVNGTTVAEDLDIYAEAGEAQHTAVVKEFTAIEHPGGDFIIDFIKNVWCPFVCAVEVYPTPPPEEA